VRLTDFVPFGLLKILRKRKIYFVEAQINEKNNYYTKGSFEKVRKNFHNIVNNKLDNTSLNKRYIYPLIVSSLCKENSLSICDVGGGIGEGYHYFRRFLNKKMEYHIYEIKDIVDLSQKYNLGELKYIEIEKFNNDKKYDIIIISATLQCLEIELIEKILNNQASIVVIVESPINDFHKFKAIQINNSTKILSIIYKRSELIDVFKKHQYTNIVELKNDVPENFHNFKWPEKSTEYRTLIFRYDN
jgi:putative methyltransferase (TIGR04325 family)